MTRAVTIQGQLADGTVLQIHENDHLTQRGDADPTAVFTPLHCSETIKSGARRRGVTGTSGVG
jgi:hypothetical protein